MNSLDLLKSLTLGVNNKITQEQESEIEYIVNTSLSNKNKKSAPPIVKEVVKTKKIDNLDLDDIDTSEIFFEEGIDEILEENFDINEDIDVSIEEEINSITEEDFFEDSYVEGSLEETFIEENLEITEETLFIEEVENENILDVVEDRNTVDKESNGHISEELKEEKKDNKIQRNGNPFKRGPRKKKEKIEKTIENLIIEEPIVEDIEEKDIVDTLDDAEFNSLFSDFSDSDEISDIEPSVCIDIVDDSEDSFDDISDSDLSSYIGVEEDFDSNAEEIAEDELQDVEELEEEIKEDTIEIEELENTVEIDIVETVIEEPIKEEVKIVEKKSDDLEFLETVSKKDKSNKVEEKNTPVSQSVEEEKFKNCVYQKGMTVEEFLRANPDYREALYVEHFFSKEELNKLIVSGLLLIKKGKYRL